MLPTRARPRPSICRSVVSVVAGLVGAAVTLSGCAVSVDGEAQGTPASGSVTPSVAMTNCAYTSRPSGFESLPTTVPPQLNAQDRMLFQQQLDTFEAGRAKLRTSPKPEAAQPIFGEVRVTLATNQGSLPIVIQRASAPCNAAAMISLAAGGYYDDTSCHRMTSGALKVIQCGDPTGTGIATPGWSSPDEPPRGFASAPNSGYEQGAVTYPRGTVAIANSGNQPGSNSGGSAQFFVVVADSALPATYAVVGQVTADGMSVLDKVYAGGIEPGIGRDATGSFIRTPNDGRPKLTLTITKAQVEQ